LAVAQVTNFSAAAIFFELLGIASAHAYNQLAFLQVVPHGAGANPTSLATFDCFGSLTNDAATVASIHMPHLPPWNSARFSLNPFDDAWGTVVLH
jgi:hypothetical protein